MNSHWLQWADHGHLNSMTVTSTNDISHYKCISNCDWFVKHNRLAITSLSYLENSLPKASTVENSSASPPYANSSGSTPTSRNGVTAEVSANPSSSKEHGGLPMIVPLISPPLIKAPAGKKHKQHKHAFEYLNYKRTFNWTKYMCIVFILDSLHKQGSHIYNPRVQTPSVKCQDFRVRYKRRSEPAPNGWVSSK